MHHKSFLETDRIRLREFSQDDHRLLLDLDSDPVVMRHLTGAIPSSAQYVKGAIQRILDTYQTYAHRYGYWAAEEKRSGNFVGWFHFRPSLEEPHDLSRIELGYRLRRSFWNQGIERGDA